jgi:sulfate transport system substrate-binding protein
MTSLHRLLVALLALGASTTLALAASPQKLLNVSYDVSRSFYKEFNPAFQAYWKQQGHGQIAIEQSHGGSSKQANAVIEGLEADVITMNSPLDIDIVAARSHLLESDWATRFPQQSSPSWSVILFLVRKGNPKGIHDWDDLVRPGVHLIIPNPKTSGNGRYSYMAAWEYAKRRAGGDEQAAQAFVAELFSHVPILDTGGRGATTSFAQRGIGDVLLTFENEIVGLRAELGDSFDTVIPSLTVRADNPVAVVSKVAAKKGTTDIAQAYLQFHYSATGQELFARNGLRPSDAAVLKRYRSSFPDVPTFTVAEAFGSWPQAQARHFASGALFDQIYQR